MEGGRCLCVCLSVHLLVVVCVVWHEVFIKELETSLSGSFSHAAYIFPWMRVHSNMHGTSGCDMDTSHTMHIRMDRHAQIVFYRSMFQMYFTIHFQSS